MKRIFLIVLFAAIIGNAMAVPAYPERITFRQPNSEISVTIYLKGDERVHWAETVDGYSLVHNDDGSLVYATRNEKGDMVASNFIATEAENRSAEVTEFLSKTPKKLRFSKSQIDGILSIWKQVENAKKGPKAMSDVVGEKKFLVILFQFSDKSFIHNKLEFRQLFNQVNYTSGGRTGSVHDYYYDVSGGLFSLKVSVVGPFTGVNNMAHYGSTDWGAQDFAREAVDSAAKYVNFADYDNDGDGYIDGLHIIFAGYGEEAGGGSNCIWSHKWNIFNAPTYNNTVVDVYSCSPECNGNNGGNITNIGVICHELGHVFGAPDYYDTDYEKSGGEYPGLGNWDIMSGGSWNRGGITPAHHNPYTKIYIYRWSTCDTLDSSPKTVVLNPAEYNYGDFHRINTSTEGDFFLIENRQHIKWDNNIPSHGMLVYHIHPSAYGRNVSNYQHPQQIYILAKAGTQDTFPTASPSSYGDLNSNTAPYPGSIANLRRDSLTDNSIPWFRPWSKQPNNTPFYYISENSTNKKIYFTIQKLSPDPMDVDAEGIDKQSIAVRWTSFGSYKTMVVANPDANVFGTPIGLHSVGDTIDGGGIVVYKGNASSCILSELLANHQYYMRLYTCIDDSTYSDGADVQARTLNCDNIEWTSENFETATYNGLPDCWSGDWVVDSLMGQQSLSSSNAGSDDAYSWRSVYSRPVTFDTTLYAVLHFRLHFDGDCEEQTTFKTEYRSNATAEWVTIDSVQWHFGMATWQDIFLQLYEAGDLSRLRFSAYTKGNQKAYIDNIELIKGSLIYSSTDANGSISPRGYAVLVDTLEYIITPLTGYELKTIKLDNSNIALSALTSLENGSFSYRLTGVQGQHKIHATFEKTVGINVEEHNLAVFPNPTSGLLNISTIPGNTITLYDIMGKQIWQQTATSDILTTNLQHLPNGIYLLRDNNAVIKVIKK